MTNFKNLYNLKKTQILITGANGQIGLSLLKNSIKSGAKVIAVDKETNHLDRLKKLKNFSNKIKIFKSDLSSGKDIKELEFKLKKLKITHLVNNAGLSIFTHWKERTESEFDQVLNVNLKSVFFLSRFFINCCSKNKIKGRIINISSIYGLVSPDQNLYTKFNRRNSEVYGASKAGLIQMTKYFASQYSKTNVLVNAIAPGGIFNSKNPQNKDFLKKYSIKCPLNRLAKVDEIIEPILFLLSTQSEYINGHTLAIDGGFLTL